MAVHTFSSRSRDDALVDEVKAKCDERGIMFSRVIIELLKEWNKADEIKQVRDTDKTA